MGIALVQEQDYVLKRLKCKPQEARFDQTVKGQRSVVVLFAGKVLIGKNLYSLHKGKKISVY